MSNYWVIFDLEATCWDTKGESWRETNPNALIPDTLAYKQRVEMETIEIGAVKVDKSFNVIDKFTVFIKPVLNPIITEYCTNLTSITQADVDSGLEFRSAYKRFMQWSGAPRTFLAWGDYDYNQLNKDCLAGNVKMFPKHKYVNAKEFIRFLRGYKGTGLGKETKRYGLEFEGRQHRGLDDSVMVAKVMQAAWETGK